MKTVVIQKAVVYDGSGKLLGLRRSNTDARRPLQWDLPGGWLEYDEEFIDGLKREIAEETGLVVHREPQLVYAKTELRSWQEDPDVTVQGNCVFLFYVVHARGSVSLSYEHCEFSWMTLQEAIDSFEYSLHKEALQYIADNQLS